MIEQQMNVSLNKCIMLEYHVKVMCFLCQVMDGLNAVPTGPVEEADCSRRLTPNELHQIIIGK